MNADSPELIANEMRYAASVGVSLISREDIEAWADRLAALPRADETRWLSLDEAHLALWKAIGAIKLGLKTDDKLILANLRDAGVSLARFFPPPPQEVKS